MNDDSNRKRQGDDPMRARSSFCPAAAAAFFLVLSAAGFGPALLAGPQAGEPEKISRFGEYKGYSPEVYDSWVRSSRYLTMRDGIRLAADIIRPTRAGVVVDAPLPVIFTHTRYRRASVRNGRVVSEADSPLAQALLRRGYVILVVDVRGSGASFGVWRGIFDREETLDAAEVIEWAARQPWCDGNVGMVGGSYLGATQLMAASARPPHLKAIFPVVPPFDLYEVGFHGGVFFDDLVRTWSELTAELDTRAPAAPVDDDPKGRLLKQALREHEANRPLISIIAPLTFRDSRDEAGGERPYLDWGPSSCFEQTSEAGVPTYLWGGWFDAFTRDVFLMQKNYHVPSKLVVGAWSHSPRDRKVQKEEFTLAGIEELRWFDHWLKGIPNGVDSEPAVRYQVMITPETREWRTAPAWPASASAPDYYLLAGRSGSVDSANDGLLGPEKPAALDGRDSCDVDFTATTGTTTRWDNAVGGGFGYPDMAANDRKGLTYTTPPLARDVEVVGHPLVRLWVSSSAADADFFAYLEEVNPTGISSYVTEGAIKASHRALNPSPYDNLGLPYHRGYREDVRPLTPGEPVEVVFDLEPTANVFNTGNRIRLTITGADKDNARTDPDVPAPSFTVYRDASRPSRISLPGAAPVETPAREAEAKARLLLYGLLLIVFLIVLLVALTIFLRRRTKD
jgi:putative CocE/NonD family hydrolase